MLNRLKELNPEINIFSYGDTVNVKKYGRKIDYVFSVQIDFMNNQTKTPESGNIYLPHVDGVEHEEISKNFYGTMPVQVGVCHGQNTKLNGLEYHMGSEIVVAMTDLVLLVAHVNNMQNGILDSKDVDGIYLEAGQAFELYQTTMHFAPCKVNDEGFMSIIILPKGTNYDLSEESDDKLLFKTNKWLIIHQEHKDNTGSHAQVGITGKNLTLNY